MQASRKRKRRRARMSAANEGASQTKNLSERLLPSRKIRDKLLTLYLAALNGQSLTRQQFTYSGLKALMSI